jgi:ribose 5-phosphate isomerase A
MHEIGKQIAGQVASALVHDGMVVGLGTGTTVRHLLDALGARVRDEGLRIVGVPTSKATAELATRHRIPLAEPGATIDLALDGADEIEHGTLRLIKGLGGALLREKVVAESSARFVVLADASKIVPLLGHAVPLPVEVDRFAQAAALGRVSALGGDPVLRRTETGEVFVTDGGHVILDCPGFAPILDPFTLERRLRAIAGVVGTGLFLLPVEQVIVGDDDGTVRILRAGADRP